MFWDFNQKEIDGMKFYGYNKSNWLGTEVYLLTSVSLNLLKVSDEEKFKENFNAILNSLVL